MELPPPEAFGEGCASVIDLGPMILLNQSYTKDMVLGSQLPLFSFWKIVLDRSGL